MLVSVAVLRWVSLAWVCAVALVNLHRVDHPVAAVAALVSMGAVTVAAQLALLEGRPAGAADGRLIVAEVVVAAAAVAVDGWVRQGPITGQSLAGTWPLAAILAAGTVAGGGVGGRCAARAGGTSRRGDGVHGPVLGRGRRRVRRPR
jgi:hypothetical protein